MTDGYSYRSWRFPVPADTVGQVVERIEAQHGYCSPRQLVDAARPPDSEIHGLFEWDNLRAADEYRVGQARRVLARLQIRVEERPQPVVALVAVRHVPNTAGGGYVRTLRAMSDEYMRAQVLRDALRQLSGLRARYDGLVELKSVWDAVDEVAEPSEE